MPCVFCGSPKLTKEHVWPDWLRNIITLPGMSDHTQTGPSFGVRKWKAPAFSTKVRCVCKGCNTGWMSDLEGAAKPLLTPMILGQYPVMLSVQDQELLALWIVKTFMMFERTHPKDATIPQAQYRYVYERRAPPESTAICAGRYLESAGPGKSKVIPDRFSQYRHETLQMARPGFPAPDSPNGYGVTLSIGQLVMQLVNFFVDGAGPISRLPEVPDVLVEIWPPLRAISWPPAIALNEKGLDAFARSFIGPAGPGPDGHDWSEMLEWAARQQAR